MKKRIFSILLTLCMVLALMPQIAFAETETFTYGDFEYSISDGKATITEYTGSDAHVTIPGSIQHENVTYPVTAIGYAAFQMNYDIDNVTIPDSVTTIGEHAFYGCPLLRSVVLPGSVTSVGWGAFDECNSLYVVFISGQSTISFGNYAFPDQASRVKYTLDPSKREAYITDIELSNCMGAVNIPEQICGYPVTEVAPEHRNKVGAHKCAGEGATCIVPQVCSICGNTFSPHSYTQENKDLNGALKSAGNCTTEAAYYYSCIHCNIIEGDDNHTFKGDKDSGNHTGSKVWKTTETQHKQYWNCCDADATDYEDHSWNDGKCSECDYVCNHKDENRNHDCDICGKIISSHTGGEATCTKQAVCSYCKKAYGDVESSNHSLDNIQAKEATVTEKGNIEYWHCTECEKCYADENGTDEISLEETELRKLMPEIIKGEGQNITAGEKKALSFTSNAAYSDFISVELDGKTLDEKNYSVKEGSTIVTLEADYVATLPIGEHTIGIVSESGTATTTFTVNAKAVVDNDTKSPQTGDNSHMALWIALLFVSGAGVIGTTVYSKKKRAK